MNRGSQPDFLQREREVLVARRGRLNQNRFKEYLPPNPDSNQSADQENRSGDVQVPDEPDCFFRFFDEGDLNGAGFKATDCSFVNETCSEVCDGGRSGQTNCDVVEDEVCNVVAGEDCRQVEEQVCEEVCDGRGGPTEAPPVDGELSEVQDAIVKAVQQQLILVIKQEIEQGLEQPKAKYE